MTTTREIQLGSLRLGGGNPLFLIAGPCVIESEAHARSMAERVAKIASDAGVPFIFKASYDKANRSSVKAFRGPGLSEGLRILAKSNPISISPSSPTFTTPPRPPQPPKSLTSFKSLLSSRVRRIF